MFAVKFDLSAFEARAEEFGEALDQVPFALSVAMNKALVATREYLIADTWPWHVSVRNVSFIGRALRIQFTTKQNLSGMIYDELGRGNLKLHETGGTIVPRGSARAAPPIGSPARVLRGTTGVPSRMRPRAIPNAIVRDLRGRGPAIWMRQKGGGLKLMYVLLSRPRMRADVPFSKDFELRMRDVVNREFPKAMLYAMRTRRRS